jgi:hypothetical protein
MVVSVWCQPLLVVLDTVLPVEEEVVFQEATNVWDVASLLECWRGPICSSSSSSSSNIININNNNIKKGKQDVNEESLHEECLSITPLIWRNFIDVGLDNHSIYVRNLINDYRCHVISGCRIPCRRKQPVNEQSKKRWKFLFDSC